MREWSNVDYNGCTLDVQRSIDGATLSIVVTATSDLVRLLAHLFVNEIDGNDDVGGVLIEVALTSSINSLNVYGRSVIQCVSKSQHICNTLPTNFTCPLFVF